MPTISLSYLPAKGDTSLPRIIYHPPSEESRPLLALAGGEIPEPYRSTLRFHAIDLDPVMHHDPRLRDYRVYLYLSNPTPDDPTDWLRFVVPWTSPPQEFRLWRLWLFYRQAPLVGEMRYEPGLGCRERIDQALWIVGRPTPEDYLAMAKGFGYVQEAIPRPGHPQGHGKAFDSREGLEGELRKAKATLQRRGAKVSRRRVAGQMGIAPSTLIKYLKRYPEAWDNT
jgi:hypothetical protein